MCLESDRTASSKTLLLPRACLVAMTAAGVLSPPAKAQNQYVGVKVCASCHGDPFHIWEKSGHAGAYRTLAKKNADGHARQVEGLWIVETGRGDKYGLPVPAAEFPHCLICHSTGAAALEIAKAVTLRRYASEKEIEAMCRTCHDGMCGDFDFQRAWPRVRHSKPVPSEAGKTAGARSGR